METKTDFFKREIAIWGEDEIYDLIERGYEPVLTDKGWYWLLTNAKVVTPV